MSKRLKKMSLIAVVSALVAATYVYLSAPKQLSNSKDDYSQGQFLTPTENQEKELMKQKFESDLSKTPEGQKRSLKENQDKEMKKFDEMIYIKNKERFSKYEKQIASYLNKKPEMKKNKELFSNYMYFISDLGANNFLSASMKISKIEAITGIGITL